MPPPPSGSAHGRGHVKAFVAVLVFWVVFVSDYMASTIDVSSLASKGTKFTWNNAAVQMYYLGLRTFNRWFK